MNQLRIYLLLTCMGVMLTMKLYAQPGPSIYKVWEKGFTKSLAHTHDMALPSWGPYSNKYNGISHVPAANDGIRFDVIVQPSFYMRNQTVLANTQRESGYHPWQASPELSYFSYRYELEWKDRVFCDVSFSEVDDKSRLIKAAFVNNTGSNRSLALNIFSTIVFPYARRVNVSLPKGVLWHKAADYMRFTDSIIPSDYNLVYNGQLRGQGNDDNAVSQTAITIGKRPGQQLYYRFVNGRSLDKAVFALRYRTAETSQGQMNIAVNGKSLASLLLPASKDYTIATLDLGKLPKGDINLSLAATDNALISLDGFVLAKADEVAAMAFSNNPLNLVPRQIAAGIPNGAVLKYDHIKEYYGFVWSDLSADQRVLSDDNPDEALFKFENLVKVGSAGYHRSKIMGNNKGWFKNIFSAPIVVKPGHEVSGYAFVVCGDNEEEVIRKLKQLNTKWGEAEAIHSKQHSKAGHGFYNRAGQTYAFCRQLMAATTLTNVMYPTFMGNKYMKHTTPGKKWSSFYTWDAGFIGLGYSELNAGRALESLNAYTMADDEQSAFLEHGTPLPVQGYLFNELWNKTQDQEYLSYFYPRLKRYYNFLGGAENSPTRKLKSNLLQTWDIFYNSGGWDDYCPQVFTHKEKQERFIAPMINTAHQIRFAKMLKMAAWQLGYQEDVEKYDADIAVYSRSVQQYAWDEKAGYFGYVKHDDNGHPVGILQHSSGKNFNMGLDGCSPLIAGICTPEQQRQILAHLFTPGELWTDQGITAIDQTAPYYSKDGYWNGRVWMAHQWFYWKTLLDLNAPEKAVQIARTALEVWKRETEDSYNCWENFSVETGNGGGWHQFGALSSPVLNWFSSLYEPGTITHGFNVWPVMQAFNINKDGFKGRFRLFPDAHAKTAAILFCLNDQHEYRAFCNGKELVMTRIFDGLYKVEIGQGSDEGAVIGVEVVREGEGRW